MPLLSDVPMTPPKVLHYGPPGSWKTSNLLTLGRRLKLLDIDLGSVDVGKTLKDNWTESRGQVDVELFRETDPTKGLAFTQLKSRVYALANEVYAKTFKRQVIGLDSLTQLTASATRYILGNSGDLPRDASIPWKNITQPQWGLIFAEVLNVVSIFRALPIPVVFLAHHQSSEKMSATELEIMAPGKAMPNQIASMMDEIWFSRASFLPGGMIEYVLQTKQDLRVMCRSRRQIPDGTKLTIGMEAILKLGGFEFPPMEAPNAKA